MDAAEHQAYQKPQYLSKDIRDLQVMQDRVLADNPLEDESESPLGEIVPAEWRVVRLEHTEPNGTRHIIERGMPLDELTTVIARPSPSTGDLEVDDSWQPGDPLPEYFDESGFPIDPSVAAALLAERSAASDEAEAGLLTEPLTFGSTIFVDLPEHNENGSAIHLMTAHLMTELQRTRRCGSCLRRELNRVGDTGHNVMTFLPDSEPVC